MPERRDGKVWWPDQLWRFLSILGPLIHNASLDDPEVEAFADHAVALLTFHQAKGLEFDHVYVALTGGQPDPAPVLRTMLFSGEPRNFSCEAGMLTTADPEVHRLARADRDREAYVALTRAKRRLTILHAPQDGHPLAPLSPSLEAMFDATEARPVPGWPNLSVREFGDG
jgi:DNA helicase-2/ATP-dependent DNA helicase PcrA